MAGPGRRRWAQAQSLFTRDSISALGACDVLFFAHDANRSSWWANQPFSPLTSNIRIALERAGLSSNEVAFFGSQQTLAYPTTTVFLMNRSFFQAYAKSLIHSLSHRLRKAGEISATPLEKLFASIIEKSEAKLIITIGLPKPLALAAHRTNVHLIEILHGFGYDPLPWDYATRRAKELPHEFWVADSLSLQTFKRLGKKGPKNKLVQPLQLEEPISLEDKNRPDSAEQSLELTRNTRSTQSDRAANVVVVLSRGGYFGTDIDGIVEDWHLLENLLVKSSRSVNWFLRLHPLQVTDGVFSPAYRRVKKLSKQYENCSWQWATESPPSLVYPRMDCLLTWGSEAVFDGHFSGLSSGVVVPNADLLPIASGQHGAFDHLTSRRSLSFLEPDSESILNWVRMQKKASPNERVEIAAQDFFSIVEGLAEQVNKAEQPRVE